MIDVILTLIFGGVAFILFVFLIVIPIIGLYVGLTAHILDEEKYQVEGARYIDGK